MTGCGGPAGINFVNSLRDAPEEMYLVGTDINKYHLEWPNVDEAYIMPRFTDNDYIEKLNKLIEKTGAEVVHPQPDGEVRILSQRRGELRAKVFLPSPSTVEICQDKFKCADIWQQKGIPVAKATMVETIDDLDGAEEVLGYPYWLRATKGFSSRGSTPIYKKETAEHWLGYWRSRGVTWEFMAQEFLPGANIAFQSIWKDGELITSQARERLEYIYPYLAPSGVTNTPVVAVTIHRDDVNRIATNSIKAIDNNATGIFCVDLKENKDGMPCPTEINAGRFFTTSYFFTKAGINMPYYYINLAYGEPIPDLPKYNAVPAGLYWIRHIDAPAVLKKEGDWRCLQA